MFVFEECTVHKIHEAYRNGELTCRELCSYYLDRISAYDQKGPCLNAVVSVNENILEEADECDRKIKEGKTEGKLFGIPIIVKDNIETLEMPTTAGCKALEGYCPKEDAFLIRKLKASGALILAKANLHELAIWGETVSSVIGQTKNPYDLTRTPGGSSGGTGALISANIGVIGIGTDTINSIRSPASACDLVGVRPTAGMVSRSGIVPYSLTQDTAGPICRTVEDAAVTLDVISGYDPEDPGSVDMDLESCQKDLKADAAGGKRIGILRSFFGNEEINEPVNQVMKEAIAVLEKLGASLIELNEEFDQKLLTDKVSVHMDEFRHDLDGWMNSSLPKDWNVHSMGDLLKSKEYDVLSEENLREAMKRNTDSRNYRRKQEKQAEVRNSLLALFDQYHLDAVVFPHQQQLVCKIGNHQRQRNGVLCSVTGCPSVVVPAGFAPSEGAVPGVPVGMEIIGRPWSEAGLLGIAYAFEQAADQRIPPVL